MNMLKGALQWSVDYKLGVTAEYPAPKIYTLRIRIRSEVTPPLDSPNILKYYLKAGVEVDIWYCMCVGSIWV